MTLQWLQSPVVETFGLTLLHSLWELSVIALMAAMFLVALRRASSNVRYLLACAALMLMTLAPVVTFVSLQRSMPQSATPSTVSSAPLHDIPLPIATPDVAIPLVANAPIEQPKSTLDRILPWLVVAYLLGTLLFTLRLLRGYFHLRRLRRSAVVATPALADALRKLMQQLRISRPVRLLQSGLVEVPTVLGHFRPIILLPISTLTGLSPDELSALLAHELAHVRRHDFLINLLQTVIETLLFYHPAIWWISAQIRREREHACDDLACSLTDPVTYARALTQMESLRAGPALSLATNTTPLLPRIRRILQLQPAPSRHKRLLTLSSTLLIAAFLGVVVYFIGCTNHKAGDAAAEKREHSAASDLDDDSSLDFEDTDSAAYYRREAKSFDRSIQEHLKQRHESKAYSDIVGLIRKRDAALQMVQLREKEEERNALVRKRIEDDIEIIADHQPFEKVIGFFRDTTNLNFYVNWEVLKAAGVDRNSPVTVNLRHVPIRKALVTVLSEVGGGAANISYTIVDGVITISTREDLQAAEFQIVRVFDIRDMLIQPDTNIRPPFGGPEPPPTTTPVAKTRDDIVREIVDTIITTVAPETWLQNGGKVGSLRELNGQLIINQTARNQRAIYQLLGQLRETRAVQIAIEARLVLVDDDTYSKLGLPAPRDKDSAGNVLDATQTTRILDAIKGSKDVATLDCPRVTLFNGQRGYLADTQQTNYVAACKSKKDDSGKLTPDYDVRTLTSGTVLFIEATASADRKHAVIKVRPTIRQLEKMETFPAPDMPASPEFYIQKPVVNESQLDLMCSVPDKNVLVLTGMKVKGSFPHSSRANGTRLQESRAANMQLPDRQLLIFICPSIIYQKQFRPPVEGLPNPNAGARSERMKSERTQRGAVIPDDIENDLIYVDRPKSVGKSAP